MQCIVLSILNIGCVFIMVKFAVVSSVCSVLCRLVGSLPMFCVVCAVYGVWCSVCVDFGR